MNTAVEQVQGRVTMIKKINEGILNGLKRIKLRSVGAACLGACAGLSLTASIIPTVVSTLGLLDSFSARWELGGYAAYSMMVWAVGGWAARKAGTGPAGAVVMGCVGIASGLLLSAVALGASMQYYLAGGVAGGFYGAVGGMLIGSTLGGEKPGTDGTRPPHKVKQGRATGSRDGVRLFRFFR